jgi:hypothetical protein
VCRPGRTLVGVVAQPVGAAVGAAHALCLGGVEVALADHPGGLVAGALQRGGGGQELHRQGGSRSLEEHDDIVLAQVWRAFPCRHAIRQGAAPPADRRRGAPPLLRYRVSPLAPGSRPFPTKRAQSAQPRSTRPRLASAFDEDGTLLLSTQSTLRRSHACRGSPGPSCDAGNNPCRRQGRSGRRAVVKRARRAAWTTLVTSGLDGRAPVPMLSSGTTTAGALRAGAAVDRMYK